MNIIVAPRLLGGFFYVNGMAFMAEKSGLLISNLIRLILLRL